MSGSMVSFDYSLAVDSLVEGGLSEETLLQGEHRGVDAVNAVIKQVENDTLGFWNLPDTKAIMEECTSLGHQLKDEYDHLVVLGIGGSSLGGRMLQDALSPDASVSFWDNVDPHELRRQLDRIDLSKCCFNVISKSGGTVETAAQFVIVRDLLVQALGQKGFQARVVVTTDREKGVMRALADEEGLRTLIIPDNVGGRFSVLTPVGLLPAAFMGISVSELLAGASSMRRRVEKADLASNPALMGALIHVQAMAEGRPIHVMMPYSRALRSFGDWYCQLWAESLGKAFDRNGRQINVGPTPVVALGATDQHSQIQLYMEGPSDKLITFLQVDVAEEDSIAFPDKLPAAYDYFKGHSVASLIRAELTGTRFALARAGHPSLLVSLSEVSAHSIGELIFFYEAQTAFAGELLNINAFDQPGVEMGKQIAFALMGRSDYESAMQGLNKFEKPTKKMVY